MSGDSDTIFALSTAGLPSAIAIMRVSGSQSAAALEALAGALPEPRKASLRHLRDPEDGTPIDQGLLLWFPGPDSATGEDVAEFHIHGSRAVAAKLAEALAGVPGLRAAEAGEFTRRAFLNGRMDLSEAEGLGDLLAAETEMQRRHALAIAEGGLASMVERWRGQLLQAEARLEAVLNFSDEGDVHEGDEAAALETAKAIIEEIIETLAAPPAERLRDGVRVALAGPPNAGKSTLFNALIAREAAIVSETPGTTRDVIEAPVDIDGIAFLLSDTAGLRVSGDAIEEEGVRRARAAFDAADIVLWLGPPEWAPEGDRVVRLRAKSDLAPKEQDDRLAVSAVTREGLGELRSLLIDRARAMLPRSDQLALNQRQRATLAAARDRLAEAVPGDWVLLSESLRRARGELDRLSGRYGVEDMLDALFGRFCIGK